MVFKMEKKYPNDPNFESVLDRLKWKTKLYTKWSFNLKNTERIKYLNLKDSCHAPASSLKSPDYSGSRVSEIGTASPATNTYS